MGAAVHEFVQQLRVGDYVLPSALILLAVSGVYRLLRAGNVARISARSSHFLQVCGQIGLLLAFEQGYEFTRGRFTHGTDLATTAWVNAYHVFDLELSHGFFFESRLERFFLPFHTVLYGIDIFYVLGHVAVTIGVLVWLGLRRPAHYPFARNLIMVTTAIALVAFYLYPTAPPRMFSIYGFVDPAQLQHLTQNGGAQPGSETYNPYAAMPSLHVAYALIAGWSLFRAQPQRMIRVATFVYPLAMAAAVLISGNHWLLDVAGAGVTVLAAYALIWAAGYTRKFVHMPILPGAQPIAAVAKIDRLP